MDNNNGLTIETNEKKKPNNNSKGQSTKPKVKRQKNLIKFGDSKQNNNNKNPEARDKYFNLI